MSESLNTAPGAAEPGPTPGTQAPVAAPAAPASLSPSESVAAPTTETIVVESAPVETVTAPAEPVVAETPAATEETKPTSILSEAVAETPAEPEKLVEPERPAEAKAEEAAPAEPEKPAAPPTYEAFVLPDGVTLAEDKLGSFTGTLGEFEQKIAADPAKAHEAFQELGQKLVELYVAEVKDTAERAARLQRETWDRVNDEWKQKFRDDPEIGKNRQDTTIQRIGGLLNLYGQQAGAAHEAEVRDAFALTGAGNHPAVLRWANWMASRLTETPRVVVPQMPRSPMRTEGSRAQRLYKNTPGAA